MEIRTRNTKHRQHHAQKKTGQQSTKHYTNSRSSNAKPTKTRDDIRYTGRASSSCSTTTIRHVTLGSHPVLVYKWGKELDVQHHASKILLNLHKQGANSWYFGPISYLVSAGRTVSNLYIFLFALHKTKGTRRLYTFIRRVKQRFITVERKSQEEGVTSWLNTVVLVEWVDFFIFQMYDWVV